MFKPEENISLSQYTTFRIGGKAKFFIHIKKQEDIQDAINFIKDTKLPYFILGGGSNILIGDGGFEGVVLKIETKGIDLKEDGQDVLVTADAGEVWDDVVAKTVESGLSGIEHLSWIPGTVGGAPAQNIGAYGKEFKDVCEFVDMVNVETGKEKRFSKEESNFQYRNSFWKSDEGKKWIITRVCMRLRKTQTSTAIYKDLKEYFEKNGGDVTPASVRETVIYIRKNKLPDVSKLGTAGSFFKNPVVAQSLYDSIKEKYPELPKFEAPNGMVKIPAAWILDNILHLKGYKEGDVGLYEKQPLAVVNFGTASSKDVENFSEKIAKKVFDATKIKLEWEVEKVGNF